MEQENKELSLNQILSLIEIATKLTGEKLDPDIRNLVLDYHETIEAGYPDETLAEEIIERLTPLVKLSHLADSTCPDPCRPYPNNEDFDGKIIIGQTNELGTVYRLSPEFLAKSGAVLCLGLPGAGKTSLFHLMKIDMHSYNYVNTVSMPLDQDDRPLIDFSQDIMIFPKADFKINIIKPWPGVSLKQHLNNICDIFAQETKTLIFSKSLLRQWIEKAIELYSRANEWPCLFDVANLMREHRFPKFSKESQYNQTLQNLIFGLEASLGDVIGVSEGYSPNILLNNHVSIEIDGLVTEHRRFMMSMFFQNLFEYKMDHQMRQGNPNFRYQFLFLDDGMHFSTKDSVSPNTEMMLCECRKFGVIPVIASQAISPLSPIISAVSGIFLIMALAPGEQREAVRRLNFKGFEDILSSLDTGQMLVKHVFGEHKQPFLVNVASVPPDLSRAVSNEEIERYMEQYQHLLTYKPRVTLRELRRIEIQTEDVEQAKARDKKLSVDETRLLWNIFNDPLLGGVQKRAQNLDLGMSRFDNIFKGLESKGLVVKVKFSNNKQGPDVRLFEITAKGLEELGVEL